MILRATRCGPWAVWPAWVRACGTYVGGAGAVAAYAAAGVTRAGVGCYGGPAARLARVLRRRLRVLGGSPAAALRAVSAWRVSHAARIRWLRTASRQAWRVHCRWSKMTGAVALLPARPVSIR